MCNYGGNLPSTDQFAIACCEDGDTNTYCLPSDTNTCSPTYNDAKHLFYTYCPRINSTGCGIYQTAGSFEIEASTTNQTFTFDNLRYKDAEYKF